jgi:ribosomal protein L11 methyltransferase
VARTGKLRGRTPLWKVSVRIAPEAEEAVVEMLAEVFGVAASVYTDTEKHTTSASVFLPKFDAEQRALLRKGLATIRAAGLNVGPGRISARRIARENWAESWKRHFQPLEISSKLLVLPSWSQRRPKAGQSVVVLDPGLSFGTGHHPTTAFCLEQIAAWRDTSREQSFLDIGTGSGILAIAASKLGYSPVVAFDFDPDAVRVATENAAVNRVGIIISRKDLTKLPARVGARFQIVCANLIYDLVIQERERVLTRLSDSGTLVLAGILNQQFPAVRRAYEEMGMRLVVQRRGGEWRSGAFRFRH